MSTSEETFRVIPEFEGPYEHWLYRAGKPYAFPDIRQFSDGDPLTTLIEFPKPVSIAMVDDNLTGRSNPKGKSKSKDPFKFLFPRLWRGDGGFHTRFLPLAKPFISAPIAPGGLSFFFKGLFEEISPAFDGEMANDLSELSGSRNEFSARFRANFPLPQSVIQHGAIRSQPDNGSWKKDPGTEAAIKAGKRLTIIGIIDDCIPFAHQNFRKASGKGTRIESCWLQSADASHKPFGPNVEPQVRFGQDYTRNQIDQLIKKYPDEDELYRRAGAIDANPELGVSLNRTATHGAHIADLAAGYPPSQPELPPDDVRIIAVQLPNTVGWDTSGFGKDVYMLAALHYIFERADKIAGAYYGWHKSEESNSPKSNANAYLVPAQHLPLVVNMSVGFTGGPHDASENRGYLSKRAGTEIEHAIDEMVTYRRDVCCAPTAVVFPSGNNFSDRMHAVLTPECFTPDGSSPELYWRIQPNDRTPSYLEMWLPLDADIKDYEVKLQAPLGEDLSFPVELPEESELETRFYKPIEIDRHVIGQVSLDEHRGYRWRILIALGATEPEPSIDHKNDAILQPQAVPAGLWKVTLTLKAASAPSEPILCWIQRDLDVQQKDTGAKQSYLDQPGYQPFGPNGTLEDEDAAKAVVMRFGSLNGMATGSTSIVVGGFRGSAQSGFRTDVGTAPFFSAAGPEQPVRGFSNGVDLAALTSPAVSSIGLLAAGTRSGSLGYIEGTSVAAPQVTRALARVFANGEADNYSKCDNYVSLLPGTPVGKPSPQSPNAYKPPDLHNPDKRLGEKFLPPIRHYKQA